jgi:hypothetical protein
MHLVTVSLRMMHGPDMLGSASHLLSWDKGRLFSGCGGECVEGSVPDACWTGIRYATVKDRLAVNMEHWADHSWSDGSR